MLYPQSNSLRQHVDISGMWEIRFDVDANGDAGGWHSGFTGGQPIAVPASWNDQLAEFRDYLGPAWYKTGFDLPWGWQERRVVLRFGSVNYHAQAWLNGEALGSHEGGHLPFEFDVTSQLRPEGNRLVVRVEGVLAPDRVPPGNIPSDPTDGFPMFSYPSSAFDFFPFCGIHRPVVLCAVPRGGIADLTVITDIDGADGLLQVRVDREPVDGDASDGNVSTRMRLTLRGHGAEVAAEAPIEGTTATAKLRVPAAALWSPEAPNLYELCVELVAGGAPFDRYTLPIGIRTIAVAGDELLLNGKPVLLRGFGRHEDFPVVGRGLLPALIIKDYDLMRWTGANSFRTTHYPYSDEMMQLADRLGFLVIDETPAVGLFFREEGLERRLDLCRQYTRELIARDKNHPSVIMWSLANEPFSRRPAAKDFFRNLYDLAKDLDATRPATLVSLLGAEEAALEFMDVVCLNRYKGWYSESGRIADGVASLSSELDELHARFPKPLLLTEFGADTVAGHHANPPEMFSEEYQAEFLAAYLAMLDAKPYVVGQHIWNLADFKTSQGVLRVGGMNLKGIFTRDRRPKLAAHRVRELWRGH